MHSQSMRFNETAHDFLSFDTPHIFIFSVSIAKNKIINPPSTKNKEGLLKLAFAFFLLIHSMNVVPREAYI